MQDVILAVKDVLEIQAVSMLKRSGEASCVKRAKSGGDSPVF